jgi:hypothetical protein
MPRRQLPLPRPARVNRRGCFALLFVILLVLIALAAIGFNADPINQIDIKIPTWGSESLIALLARAEARSRLRGGA